jgi:hypothetical protein
MEVCNHYPISRGETGWNLACCPAFLEVGHCPVWYRRWYWKIRNWYLNKRYGRTVTQVIDQVEIYDPRYDERLVK